MTALVELESVRVSRGGKIILEDISLTRASGDSVAILGPNGSGKTTLLKLLATLIRPEGGRGSILGTDVFSPGVRKIRRRVGLISHNPALIEELTLAENLRHFSNLAGTSFNDCIRALDIVGLGKAGDRKAGESSFGMQRRAEIAWLLVAKPELLLLDEAKSGLDIEARELIDALVDLTLERHGVAVAVSHESSQLGEQFQCQMYLTSGRLESSK